MKTSKIQLSKTPIPRSWIVRALATTLLAVVALFVWQFYSMFQVSDAARNTAKQEWASLSSARSAFLQEYESKCERSAVSENEIKTKPPRSFEQCAEHLASERAVAVGLPVSEAMGLSRAISAAAESAELPAPLRWL